MKFCGECGTPVGAPAEAPAEPAEPAPPSGPRLVINPDDEATVVVLTKDETTLNRSEEADVVLKDGYVSSHHAVVTKKDDGYWIKDVGSTNGTFIQVRSEILLKPGDVLKLGQTLVRFED
jgi:pSer/pThr/pTyr-binding forkhead associated (FHA) protein